MIRIDKLDGHYHDIRVVEKLPQPTGNYKSLYTILDQDCMQVFYRMKLDGSYETLGEPVAAQAGVTSSTHIVRTTDTQEAPPTSTEIENPSENDTAIVNLSDGIIEFWTYKSGSWNRDFYGNTPQEDVVTTITTHIVRADDIEEVPPTNVEAVDPIENDTAIVKLSNGVIEFWTHTDIEWVRDFVIDNSETSLFPTQEVTAVLSNGKSLGKYLNGDTIPSYDNPTQMLTDLAIERIAPTIISNRSVSLTLNTASVEVGTQLNFTLSSSFNRGLIDNKDRVANTILVGIGSTPLYSGLGLDPVDETINVIETTDTTVSMEAISGTMTWTVRQPYAQGTDPYYDSAGNVANDLDAQRVAGSVSASKSKVGRYKVFAGAVNSLPTNNSEILALQSNVFENASNITFNSTNTKNIFVLLKRVESGDPTTLTGVTLATPASPVLLDQRTTISYTLPNGNIIQYYMYYAINNNPFSADLQIRFTL